MTSGSHGFWFAWLSIAIGLDSLGLLLRAGERKSLDGGLSRLFWGIGFLFADCKGLFLGERGESSEAVSEPEVQVDGVEREGYGLERFIENSI